VFYEQRATRGVRSRRRAVGCGSGSAGAALLIALLLLLILTLLATAGMRMSIAELWMAGNEQYRRKASDAASAGIEVAIARVSAGVVAVNGAAVGSRVAQVGPAAVGDPSSETYTASVLYTGKEASLPGSSAEKLTGEHVEIVSAGTSVRGARDVQVQGLMVVSPTSEVKTLHRIGTGLETASGP
jgi:hypothetical protein